MELSSHIIYSDEIQLTKYTRNGKADTLHIYIMTAIYIYGILERFHFWLQCAT